MTVITCPLRERILDAEGHVLVTGGPGCGKTTIALQKASSRISDGLSPEQRVLFLSFSRAAVARIAQAARTTLPRESFQHIDIQTFHSFCWQLVRGHGYLLGAASPINLLSPHDERAMRQGAKTDGDPAWDAERERLFTEEGRIAFDLFAPKALSILRSSNAYRNLYADRYPLIIVDEAQDTGTEQWGCIQMLAGLTQVVCLADLDQQIYDFRRDVSPKRLGEIMNTLMPLEVNLGSQNNRSPDSEIVQFGNDILAQTPRGSPYAGVSRLKLNPKAIKRDQAIRSAIGVLCRRVEAAIGTGPESIGFLTNWGKGVTIIAKALQGGDKHKEIPHQVVMDEAAVLLATRVVALCLEPVKEVWPTLATGLELIGELYRASGNGGKAEQLLRNATDARVERLRGNARCAPGLKVIIEHLQANPLTGSPGDDWLTVRSLFDRSGIAELQLVARQVIYLMVFNRGRRISDALAEVWQRRGQYEGARALIESAIAEDQIIGSDGDLSGINVMTMHKSKGKEFDGVIILHLGNNISPLSSPRERPPHLKSRRLLRVAITRARHHTLLLTDAFSESPLLAGHRL